ncbi:MAG TPA: PilN domain-containing protein [Polyangia bacterium]|nr:PilN domain-containing protein [Polyangia bacterium]
MIRINLLPIKQDRRRESGRNQILAGVLLIVIELAVFGVFYYRAQAAVDLQRNANEQVQNQVKRIESQVQDHKSIIKEIEEYEKRQDAIESLLAARTGPVFVMLELSEILSKGGRPHLDNDRYQELVQKNPAAGFDENWDYRRLWINTFSEKERKVKIAGQGLTHEDVAEFLRRLNLSDFFVTSELVSTTLAPPKIDKLGFSGKEARPVVHFALEAQVRYR